MAPSHEYDFVGMPADPLADILGQLHGSGENGALAELYLGVEDGTGVALAMLELPTRDNLDEAEITVSVAPSERRRGLARAMQQRITERCAELGRGRLLVQVPGSLDGVPSASECFARSEGFTLKLQDIRRLLDLHDLDLEHLRGVEAAAAERAVGYELAQWVDRAPEPFHPGLAALSGRMSLDAPQGDLDRDPEVWDAGRWVAGEDDAIARDRLRLGTLALAGSEVVAYSDIGINGSQPTVGYQWNTIVRGDHRGHRLGMLVKAANLRLLRAESPRTRWLNTWNATSNTYMISINEALGFHPVDSWGEWQREL